MRPNPQETADLVLFTEEILNVRFHFLCSVTDCNSSFPYYSNAFEDFEILSYSIGSIPEVHSKLSQKSKMKLSEKIINYNLCHPIPQSPASFGII